MGAGVQRTIWTPLAIKILLQAHVYPWLVENYEAPAVRDEVERLTGLKAVEPVFVEGRRETMIGATALGKAWVEALCRVQIPRAVFLDEQGREL